jgi:hypothetical protein
LSGLRVRTRSTSATPGPIGPTERTISGSDTILSSHHDSAGSTRIDVDSDAADYPILLADHVQLTGVHANAHGHAEMVH